MKILTLILTTTIALGSSAVAQNSDEARARAERAERGERGDSDARAALGRNSVRWWKQGRSHEKKLGICIERLFRSAPRLVGNMKTDGLKKSRHLSCSIRMCRILFSRGRNRGRNLYRSKPLDSPVNTRKKYWIRSQWPTIDPS